MFSRLWVTDTVHTFIMCVLYIQHILKELLNACHGESKLFTLPTASAPRLVLTGTSIMYSNEMLLLLCTIYPVASSKVFVYKEVNVKPMGWVHPRTARNVAQHFCKWQHPLDCQNIEHPWHYFFFNRNFFLHLSLSFNLTWKSYKTVFHLV